MANGQGVRKANNPSGLPIVERCVQKAKSQRDMSKDKAIAVCVKALRRSGRIRKTEQGWVQVQKGQSQQQGQTARRKR